MPLKLYFSFILLYHARTAVSRCWNAKICKKCFKYFVFPSKETFRKSSAAYDFGRWRIWKHRQGMSLIFSIILMEIRQRHWLNGDWYLWRPLGRLKCQCWLTDSHYMWIPWSVNSVETWWSTHVHNLFRENKIFVKVSKAMGGRSNETNRKTRQAASEYIDEFSIDPGRCGCTNSFWAIGPTTDTSLERLLINLSQAILK